VTSFWKIAVGIGKWNIPRFPFAHDGEMRLLAVGVVLMAEFLEDRLSPALGELGGDPARWLLRSWRGQGKRPAFEGVGGEEGEIGAQVGDAVLRRSRRLCAIWLPIGGGEERSEGKGDDAGGHGYKYRADAENQLGEPARGLAAGQAAPPTTESGAVAGVDADVVFGEVAGPEAGVAFSATANREADGAVGVSVLPLSGRSRKTVLHAGSGYLTPWSAMVARGRIEGDSGISRGGQDAAPIPDRNLRSRILTSGGVGDRASEADRKPQLSFAPVLRMVINFRAPSSHRGRSDGPGPRITCTERPPPASRSCAPDAAFARTRTVSFGCDSGRQSTL